MSASPIKGVHPITGELTMTLPEPRHTPQRVTPTPTPTPGPEPEIPVAGPSTTPVPAVMKKAVKRSTKAPVHDLMAATTAYVPNTYNVKYPAGFFANKEINNEVSRQVSQAKIRRAKEEVEAEKRRKVEAGEELRSENPLDSILIIHPGSRRLRVGRASDFYPKEVPNCIARPDKMPNRGRDPPRPGERRGKRSNAVDSNTDADVMDEDEPLDDDPVENKIGYLRDYLKNRLIQQKLATDWRDATRVVINNGKVRPEGIPEHNDPYRIDWTELDGRKCFVGTDAIRLPPGKGFTPRWPILNRRLNTRDWPSLQLLMDDIATILQVTLDQELGIAFKYIKNYSVVLIVPDYGDKEYIKAMTHLLLVVLGFKEIAVHQESYAAIFSAGMSSACVVDIGAQMTSITCIDEGLVVAESRMSLAYGGDDITTALAAILKHSAFPYRDLDLAKSQEWLMMDNLKIKICTLEEQLVASTMWDFYVLKTEGLTQKYVFRTYDENILAPLCFFDTRIIDFNGKKGDGDLLKIKTADEVDDLVVSVYGDTTAAMKACVRPLQPTAGPVPTSDAGATPVKGDEASTPKAESNADVAMNGVDVLEAKGEDGKSTAAPSRAASPAPVYGQSLAEIDDSTIAVEASHFPLDAAIAASISTAANESKAKTAASAILVIGGSSALKGLNGFLEERIPPLLRARNLPIQEVHIVPPPRSVNPRFVSWKGASVMCNLETLSDMWISREEWDAVGVRALKDRYLFY